MSSTPVKLPGADEIAARTPESKRKGAPKSSGRKKQPASQSPATAGMTMKRSLATKEMVENLVAECAKWINTVLELGPEAKQRASEADLPSFFSSISDGVLLCRVIQKLDPTFSYKIVADTGASAFHARDNIVNFLRASKELGVEDVCIFEVDDLATGRNSETLYQRKIAINILDLAREGEKRGVAMAPAICQFMFDNELDKELLAQAEKTARAAWAARVAEQKKPGSGVAAAAAAARAQAQADADAAGKAAREAREAKEAEDARLAKLKAEADELARKQAEEAAAAQRKRAQEEARLAELKAAEEAKRLADLRAKQDAADKAAREAAAAAKALQAARSLSLPQPKHGLFKLMTSEELRRFPYHGKPLALAVKQLYDKGFPADSASGSAAAAGTAASLSLGGGAADGKGDSSGESKRTGGAGGLALGSAGGSAADDQATIDEFMKRACGFHDEKQCVWLLLWSHSEEAEADVEETDLVGMCTLVPFHLDLYVCNLTVRVEDRRQGWGGALLHEAQDEAARRKLQGLSGTVEASDARLQRYYASLGASVLVGNAAGGAGSSPPPSQRLRKAFGLGDDGIVRDEDRAPGFSRTDDIRLLSRVVDARSRKRGSGKPRAGKGGLLWSTDRSWWPWVPVVTAVAAVSGIIFTAHKAR